MLVKENINFIRGQNPKEALKLGFSRFSLKKNQFFEEMDRGIQELLNKILSDGFDKKIEDIYFLGYSDNMDEEYLEKLEELTGSGEMFNREDLETDSFNAGEIIFYETNIGIIAEQIDQGGSNYFGDLEVAGKLNLPRRKIL
jgi:hypothetical protein